MTVMKIPKLLMTIALFGFSLGVIGKPSTKEELFKSFEDSMKNVRFSGHFTITGRDMAPSKETYEIQKVEKLGDGDLWIFTARVKYGDKDVVLPMPLPVKWLGRIPVITMDKVTLPGLGTFSAHVVIDGDKYAGTWAHGEVGGHLYGTISRIKK
tara:strand:- start:640 stop:1101 length:462 start_codon:yes stop_codon:yes gene_type:complete